MFYTQNNKLNVSPNVNKYNVGEVMKLTKNEQIQKLRIRL
jgi:hypothetical protein